MAENRKWKGNTGGGTFGQRALILLFRWCDLRLGYAFMALVIPFYMLFSRKGYLAIYHYFRKQFGYSVWKSFAKTYQNHFLFGQMILDRFVFYSGRKNLFEVEIIDYKHFLRLANGEKGFIIAGSHVGNFEIGGYLINSDRKNFNALVYAGETAEMQKNRSKILNSNNINLIPILSDMSHLFAINAALQNGEIVSMPCDRNLGSAKSIECDFLRGKADFPVGAFTLAASFDVEVLAVFVIKISTKKYKVYVKDLRQTDKRVETESNKKSHVSYLVKSYVTELENIVKQYPLQWFNFYEFWKDV